MALMSFIERKICAVYFLVVLVAFFVIVRPDCNPVQEGNVVEINCTLDKLLPEPCEDRNSSELLVWTFYGLFRIRVYCDINQCRVDSDPFEVYAEINEFGSSLTSRLTIQPNSRYLYQDFLRGDYWRCYSYTNCYTTDYPCNELEVYALPSETKCTTNEVLNSESDLTSVNITCTATNIYPYAKCIFYHIKDDGNQMEITHEVESTWTGGGYPYYYNWTCQINIPVSELGEGSHRFEGRVYPDVTGGEHLEGVDNTPTTGQDIVLTLPNANFSCSTEVNKGYFKGREAFCKCTLHKEGIPRGTPQWYKDATELPHDSDGSATLIWDFSNPHAVYSCKAKSAMGERDGGTIAPLFAFLDSGSVEVKVSPPTSHRYQDNTQNTYVIITCRVKADRANPGVYFRVSQAGLTVEQRDKASISDGYFQTQFVLDLDTDKTGLHEVSCHAQNTIYPSMTDEKSTSYHVSEENLVVFDQSEPTKSNDGNSVNVADLVLAIICGVLAVSLGVTVFFLIRKKFVTSAKSDQPAVGGDLTDLTEHQTSCTSITEEVETTNEVKTQTNRYEEVEIDSPYTNQSAIVFSHLSSSETDDPATTYDVPRPSDGDTEHQYVEARHPNRQNEYVDMKRPCQEPDNVYNN